MISIILSMSAAFGELSKKSQSVDAEAVFLSSLRNVISKNFNGAEIELTGPVNWIKGEGTFGSSLAISYMGTNPHGDAHFTVFDTTSGISAEGLVEVNVWVQAKIAVK